MRTAMGVSRCGFDGITISRHRRSWSVVTLWLISTPSRPDNDAIATALDAAGERHCVIYRFVTPNYA